MNNFEDLITLSLAPLFRAVSRWWWTRVERHCLICADVENQKAREHQANAAYYQKRAAIARSNQI